MKLAGSVSVFSVVATSTVCVFDTAVQRKLRRPILLEPDAWPFGPICMHGLKMSLPLTAIAGASNCRAGTFCVRGASEILALALFLARPTAS